MKKNGKMNQRVLLNYYLRAHTYCVGGYARAMVKLLFSACNYPLNRRFGVIMNGKFYSGEQSLHLSPPGRKIAKLKRLRHGR